MRHVAAIAPACLLAAALLCLGGAADADSAVNLTGPPAQPETTQPVDGDTTISSSIDAYFNAWATRVAAARASQPIWSSPVVTTTAMLEQRFRVDTEFQHAGNGADTVELDGGKGLDLIIGETTELQIAADPYEIRSTTNGKNEFSGFADWPVLRLKERLASAPAGEGNYVVSAWLQLQAPDGIEQLTSKAYTLLPTLGFGKGWGAFDIQGTIGFSIPTAYQSLLGTQLLGNLAFQYNVMKILWPQLEVNWTDYLDGTQRGGKNQVFLTPGLVVGKLRLTDALAFTFGVGYESAVSPDYRKSPLLPSYNHAWIATTRLSF